MDIDFIGKPGNAQAHQPVTVLDIGTIAATRPEEPGLPAFPTPKSDRLNEAFSTRGDTARKALDDLAQELVDKASPGDLLTYKNQQEWDYLRPKRIITQYAKLAAVGAALGYGMLDGDALEGVRQATLAMVPLTAISAVTLPRMVRFARRKSKEDPTFAGKDAHLKQMLETSDSPYGPQVAYRHHVDDTLKNAQSPVSYSMLAVGASAAAACLGTFIANRFGADLSYGFTAAATAAAGLVGYGQVLWNATRYGNRLDTLMSTPPTPQ